MHQASCVYVLLFKISMHTRPECMAMASSTLHEVFKVCILLQVQHNQDMSLLHLQHGTSEGSYILHQRFAKMKTRKAV